MWKTGSLTISSVALLIVWPSVALSQGAPGTNLVVDVHVVDVAMDGDLTRVRYVLRNLPQSAEELFTFTVDAPSPVLKIFRPEPLEAWDVSTQYRGRSVADWAMLGTHLAPGAESPSLFFDAIGLPGIVTSWVRGYFPPPPLTEADVGVIPPSDPLLQNSVPGKTVGIEPFPDDLSPTDLLRRLRELTDQTCGELGWIDNAGICDSLDKNLQNAERSLERGRANSVRGQLGAFLNELQAQRGKHVNDSAYWLLKANVEFVLSQL